MAEKDGVFCVIFLVDLDRVRIISDLLDVGMDSLEVEVSGVGSVESFDPLNCSMGVRIACVVTTRCWIGMPCFVYNGVPSDGTFGSQEVEEVAMINVR